MSRYLTYWDSIKISDNVFKYYYDSHTLQVSLSRAIELILDIRIKVDFIDDELTYVFPDEESKNKLLMLVL